MSAKSLQKAVIIGITNSIIKVKHPNLSANPKSALNSPIDKTATSMSVYDNNGLADNDWFIVGDIGDNQTEECDINGAVTRGTALTITNTLKLDHEIDAPVTKINEKDIPEHDVLCAGFPCQPFSIAGDKKGFEDTRGTLFFDIIRILKEKKPKAVILENVKHFKNHDKGRTLQVILNSLKEIGYTTNWKVLNAKDFGIPQNRERTIIVGFLDNKKFDFNLLNQLSNNILENILEESNNEFEFLNENEYTLIDNYKKQNSGLIFIGYRNKKIRTKGVRPNTEHLSRVHKQPNRIYSSKGTHPTLSSQESSGRYFIYHDNKVRKLTLKECYRLMGFSDDFKLIGSKANLYNRVVNSVVIPMIEAIAEIVKEYFEEE